jgi:signal recognition particle subunit SRP54
MVLSDLGRKLTSALSNLASAPDVDEALVDEVLKEITAALLESDVNVKLVGTLRNRVKAKVVPLLASKGSTNVRNSLQRVRNVLERSRKRLLMLAGRRR